MEENNNQQLINPNVSNNLVSGKHLIANKLQEHYGEIDLKKYSSKYKLLIFS